MQQNKGLYTILKKTFLLLFLLSSTVVFGQRTLGLDKKGKVKRIHFYEGSHIKIKLITKEKVSGNLNGIFDSSFVIDGRKIRMDEVAMVYSTRKTMRFFGGALMVAGAFYFTVDMVNNLLNYGARGYVFSNSVWQPTVIAVSSGAILYYFSTRRTKVYDQGNFRIYNTTPIPIQDVNEAEEDPCADGEIGVIKPYSLDGCTWVVELPSGANLEPINYKEFFTEEELAKGDPIRIRIKYTETKSPSICMVGRTVAINCIMRL